MKKKFLVILPFLFFGGLAAIKLGCAKTPVQPQQCTFASPWKTVNEVSLSASTEKGLGTLLSAEPLFAMGLKKDAADRLTEPALQISLDGGKDWTSLETLRPGESLSAIFASKEGPVFSVGSVIHSDGRKHWLVRLSGDGGNAWVTVDHFQAVPGLDAEAMGGLLVSPRELYVVGAAGMSPSQYHWIVRHTTDGGEHWKIVDQLNYGGAGASMAHGIAMDSSGTLYVSGTVSDGIKKHWLVRKSADQGDNWTTSEDFQYSPAQDAAGGQIVVDSSDNVFVEGSVLDSLGKQRWLVRRTENSGDKWTTSDDFQWESGAAAEPRAIAVSRASILYTAGTATDGTGHPHWTVRHSFDKGMNWTTADEFTYPTDFSSEADAIGVDAGGNVYASGYVYEKSGSPKAVLRRQGCD